MTATDELRRLLDERGVEYDGGGAVVYFKDSRGYKAMAYEAPRRYGNGVLCVHHTATPAQAVEATLGRGTCRLEREPDSDRLWWCSNCHMYHEHVSEFPWRYCPRCGAKVVDG